jgi:hypothetical protein
MNTNLLVVSHVYSWAGLAGLGPLSHGAVLHGYIWYLWRTCAWCVMANGGNLKFGSPTHGARCVDAPRFGLTP